MRLDVRCWARSALPLGRIWFLARESNFIRAKISSTVNLPKQTWFNRFVFLLKIDDTKERGEQSASEPSQSPHRANPSLFTSDSATWRIFMILLEDIQRYNAL